MNQRFYSLWAQSKQVQKTAPGDLSGTPRINLFAEPGFGELSFMKRVARMTEATLDAAAVRIFPGEFIIGSNIATQVRADYTTLEERRTYADQNLAYPRRNNITVNGEKLFSSTALYLTEEELKDHDCVRWGWGHSCGGFKKILTVGYNGILAQAGARLEALRSQGCKDTEKTDFLEAVITCVSAVIRYARRHAAELERMAAQETDSARAEEMGRLAAVARKVPAEPAETFHEAVQSVWFAWMCGIRYNGTDIGRLDQYLYPYYAKDLAAGRITYEEARDIIGYFMIKCFEDYIIHPSNAGLSPSIMLGGLNADGKDGVNDVTYMFLEVESELRTPTPKLSIRVNEQTPQRIFELAHRMLLSGINQPDFYVDRNVLNAYLRMDIPMEDAVEYAQSVCEELSLAGISEDCTNEGPHCDVHDRVMIALRRVAAGEEANAFEDFVRMVEAEIRTCILEEIGWCEKQYWKLRKIGPRPLHSAAIAGCLENALDITAGGAKYNNTGSVIGGLASAADALYTIRKLVYEDKRLTVGELLSILEHNYEGQEVLRQEILHKFPKYGNGCEEVDTLAGRLFGVYADELERHTNSRGGRYKVGAWASEYRSPYGATADGRRQGDAMATNISPTPGRDLKGVTAVLRSATHVPLKNCAAGGMVDVAMTPSCLKGEHGPLILRRLLEAYGEMGGTGLQFNVVDVDTLQAALADPDSYRNLMVRVWGYNDYFTALTPERQSHILNRTIQESM